MSTEWIMDREPTRTDADDEQKLVWVMSRGNAVLRIYYNVCRGQPWKPIVPPEPYVKPKRWTVRYNPYVKCWSLHIDSKVQMILYGLDRNNDEHRQAAERIADIYEETLP